MYSRFIRIGYDVFFMEVTSNTFDMIVGMFALEGVGGHYECVRVHEVLVGHVSHIA